MYSKNPFSFFQLLFLFSILFFIAETTDGQTPRAYEVKAVNISFGKSEKIAVPNRPRIINEKESPNVLPAKKALTNYSFERRAFDEINDQRTAIGLQPLIWSDEAARVARVHSENMANFKFFSHEGLDGKMVNDRADAFGVNKWKAIGENIAYNRGYKNPIEFAVECWMKSTGHRENILNGRWKEAGIGIAITAEGDYYFTQVFLDRK